MPMFISTHNIFVDVDGDEVFNPNWMDSNTVVLPPKTDWDYQRDLKLEDVNIWEILYQGSGGVAVYASWDPYAEFYLIRSGWANELKNGIELYYGVGAQKHVKKRIQELNLPIPNHKIWVEPEDMWLYA